MLASGARLDVAVSHFRPLGSALPMGFHLTSAVLVKKEKSDFKYCIKRDFSEVLGVSQGGPLLWQLMVRDV